MHVSGYKIQKTFIDNIKLSSDEIAGEIDTNVNGANDVLLLGVLNIWNI